MDITITMITSVIVLARIDSKGRQGAGGRHVSPINSAVLSSQKRLPGVLKVTRRTMIEQEEGRGFKILCISNI